MGPCWDCAGQIKETPVLPCSIPDPDVDLASTRAGASSRPSPTSSLFALIFSLIPGFASRSLALFPSPRLHLLLRPHLNKTSREFLGSVFRSGHVQALLTRLLSPLCWELSASNPSIKDISASLLCPIRGCDTSHQRSSLQ